MADQIENGSSFRILTLIDEHTRQCLAIHPAWSIRAVDVITVVEAAIARYGVPEHLRSDNGPEFIAYCIQDWLNAQEIKTLWPLSHTVSGAPLQGGLPPSASRSRFSLPRLATLYALRHESVP